MKRVWSEENQLSKWLQVEIAVAEYGSDNVTVVVVHCA